MACRAATGDDLLKGANGAVLTSREAACWNLLDLTQARYAHLLVVLRERGYLLERPCKPCVLNPADWSRVSRSNPITPHNPAVTRSRTTTSAYGMVNSAMGEIYASAHGLSN
jgi:hypothetical protein